MKTKVLTLNLSDSYGVVLYTAHKEIHYVSELDTFLHNHFKILKERYCSDVESTLVIQITNPITVSTQLELF